MSRYHPLTVIRPVWFFTNYTARQEGFIAIFTLVMLGMLTLVATSAFDRTVVDEQMVGNIRDKAVSSQRTELALRAGEAMLNNLETPPFPELQPDSIVWLLGDKAEGELELIDPKDSTWILSKAEDWWQLRAQQYDDRHNSHYIVEEQTIKHDSLVMRNQYTSGRPATYYYRITARADGNTIGKSIVQSTYAKRFN